MTSRTFSQSVGILFLAVGLLGFIPGLRSVPPVPGGPVAIDGGYGYLFDLFPVNWVHNLVHLSIGIAGLYSSRSAVDARQFARGLAWFYGALAVMGLLPILNTMFGLAPLYGHNIWLHAATAAAAAYFGYGQRAEIAESIQPYRRAA